MPREVEKLNFEAIKKSIHWRGMLRLHQLGEDDESLIGLAEWPKESGTTYYACATTGLLFDKETGRCLQSQTVTLLLDTMAPASPKDFSAYMASKKKLDYWRSSKHMIVDA